MKHRCVSPFLMVLINFLLLGSEMLGQTAASGDPNDSGYSSLYLSSLNPSNLTSDEELTRAHVEAMRQARGRNLNFTINVLRQANQQRMLFPQLMPGATPPAGVPVWTAMGPSKTNHIQNGVTLNVTDSGRMSSILVHPTNPDIVYVVATMGGLWKSTNFSHNKRNWVPLTDALGTTSGGAAAFGHNPNTIYLGLGDPFDGNGLTGGVMMKTTDGGNTWGAPISLLTAASVRDVKVDTTGGHDTVLVATDGGLYVSTDEGATYNLATSAVLIDGRIAFPNGVWNIVNTSQGWLASVQSQFIGLSDDGTTTLAISTDHGATWNAITNTGNIFSGAGRTTLGVASPGDNVVYAFAATVGDVSQLDGFRSSDGGQTWVAMGLPKKTPVNPNPDAPDMNLMGGQAFYNQMVLVDPTDPSRNTVYFGGQLSSAKSIDGGNSWRIIANWLGQFGLPYVHADYHSAAFSTATKTALFGSDGGLFTSNDGGSSWDDSANWGLITLQGYSIMSNPLHPASTLMGTQDNGTFVRWGNSMNWEQPIGGDGIGSAWSQANADIALGTVEFDLIFNNDKRNPSRQAKWNVASSGINRTFANFFTSLSTPRPTTDATGLAFLTYTNRQIYKTADGGNSWTEIGHTALPPSTPPSLGIGARRRFRDTPHGVGVSPTADGLMHVAVVCNAGWLVVTHDAGATWHQTPIFAQIAGWTGFNATAEWADDRTLFVGSESPFSQPRVAKSTDGGLTFTQSDMGLPDVPVNRILVSPTNPNTIYAATFLGVYRSTDGGANWSRFGAGLPFVEARDLYMPPDGSFLRIATYGRSVWETQP